MRDRIAGGGRIGGDLSGGLDSGGVMATAARRLQQHDRRLTAFTAVPAGEIDPADYPRRIVDEGALAALTAASFPNIDHVRVANFAGSMFDASDRASRAMDCPVAAPVNSAWLDAIGEEARRRGVGVLLTGQMGNMTMSYNGSGWLVDLCRSGRWGELLREFRGLVRQGASWPSLINRYMLGRAPAPLRRMVRTLAGRPELDFRQYSMIRPEFAARLRLLEQAREISGDLTNIDRRGDMRVEMIETLDLAMYGRAAKRMYGFDRLDPTADRRLVEYCLAIPQSQFLRDGQPRSLMLRAMEGVLPDAVLRERRRGLQSADWHVGLAAARDEIVVEIERLSRSPLASEALDLPRLRRMVENWPSGGWGRREIYYPYCFALTKGLAVGRHIRQVEGVNG
ncbi:asparagine synthase-related protein [Methylosinus trichosporium]|uniref:asparagine synthase-related protein n=1 Tax=Methylosinus trichosporium TaxID=426 RepID=UPI0024B8CB86|nr:asparagine synthase-related protein [Methylosinus trichosporium]